jgi:phosphohistidine phosphatase
MATLILMRHGKAVRDHEAPTDRARGLIDRGREEAAAAAEAMIAAGLSADLALVSDAARTRETWAAMAPRFAGVEVRFEDALYLAEAEEIWRLARSCGADRILIVGHNPGLADLAARFVDAAHDGSRLARKVRDGLATAAFAAFKVELASLDAAAPELIAAYRPERG